MIGAKSPRLRRGQTITARYLNGQADQIDALRNALVRLAGGAGVQAIDTQADQSNLSPAQLLDPGITSPGLTQNLAAGHVMTELARVTSIVRVENPSDPAQYVDVERVDVITFEGAAGERLTLVFNH